jgi:signal transduction histidine kinase
MRINKVIQCDVRDVTDRKRAEEALQARHDELQWLHQISQRIFQSDELKETAQIILDAALLASSCDLGVFRLLSRKTGVLEPIASRGFECPGASLRPREFLADEPLRLLTKSFNLKQTIVLEKLQGEPGLQTFKNEGIESLIMVPVRTDDHMSGILQLGSRTPRTFEHNLINLLETLGYNLGIAVQKADLLEDSLASRNQLRNYARRLVESQEIERRHIALELHDEIGGILTGLRLTLFLVAESATSVADTDLGNALGMVDTLIERVRDLALRLRPAMLDDLGLLPALLWYLQNYAAHTNIHVNFEHRGLDRRFSTELETTAYRIVQESLTNAARHAKVSEISVRISANRQFFRIEIEDQGSGFNPNATTPTTAGLSGMRERAASLGGNLDVQSAPGAGTRVLAEFSLEEGRSDFTESRSADA